MTAPSLKIEGLEQVRQKLKQLGSQETARRINKRAGKEAMQPLLKRARAEAPKVTGLLAESLGVQTKKRGNIDFVFYVAPRRSFRGKTTAVADSRKAKEAHRAKGLNIHEDVPPFYYGVIIQTGHKPEGSPQDRFLKGGLGRKIRKANPFLTRTYDAMKERVPEYYSNSINSDLSRLLPN